MQLAGLKNVIKRTASHLVLPYSRRELPGWGRLVRMIEGQDAWQHAPTVSLVGKWHHLRMNLDLANWSDRQTYWLGRYYDLSTQLLLMLVLHEGDEFVDVGANVGMMCLTAEERVGPTGVINCFEPNPIAFEKLSKHVSINGLKNVRLHNCALAAEPGEAVLTVIGDHTGAGTLGRTTAKDALPSQQHVVQKRRGDDLLELDSDRHAVLKIDVEGYETQVLQSLRQFIARRKPVIVNEVVRWYLENAGSSVAELFELMKSYDYSGYFLSTRRVGFKHDLVLLPVLDHTQIKSTNIVWLHKQAAADSSLLAKYILK